MLLSLISEVELENSNPAGRICKLLIISVLFRWIMDFDDRLKLSS